MKPRKPLPRSTKPIRRSRIKRRVTKRKKALLQKTQGALDIYFALPVKFSASVSEISERGVGKPDFIKACQICAGRMYRSEATPAHLWKRHHGRHEPHEILAAHLLCHTWLDNGAHPERIEQARASGISCSTGGVVPWTQQVLDSLIIWRMWGNDPLGNPLPRSTQK